MLSKRKSIPIEAVILQAIEELSEKYKLERNVIVSILKDYDTLVSPHLLYEAGAESLVSVN